jgi:hypothetical protein
VVEDGNSNAARVISEAVSAHRSALSKPLHLLLLGLLGLPALGARAKELYVSPLGNDAHPGTKARPFASPERARAEIRQLPTKTRHEPITVFLRGGEYRRQQALALGAEDAGTAGAPITWRAYPGEEVRFLGGVRLAGFRPVTDSAIRARLSPAARDQVMEVDLKAAGVSHLGQVTAADASRADLVFDHHYLPLARYPNAGDWLRVAAIPEGGTKHEFEGVVHYGRFSYDTPRPAHWQDTSDLWVHGYWVYDWSDQYQRVEKLDLERKEVWPQPPYHHYGYKKGQRFYFLNVLEELDQPGEWYLDRKTATLYFWPPTNANGADLMFPELQSPMLVLSNASQVCLRGITFECSRAGAIVVNGGSGDEIVGCTLRNVGDPAIEIKGGAHHRVRSCDIYEVAGAGINVEGGDRKSLTRGEHSIENCHIHHYARLLKTYKPAVQLHGVGNRIVHCAIHDAPHMGIGYAGNDHVIEYCDFYRIAQETGDVGVTYAMGDWTFMGHEFRFNYFHNIHGPGNLGCFTIYPDLPCGGIHLHGNVFLDVDQVFHSNSGRGMVIEDNLFLRCGKGFSFLPWDDASMFQEGGAWKMVEHLKEVNYDQPPYSVRYPVLQGLARDFSQGVAHLVERELPKENVIRHNISWGKTFLVLFRPATLDHVRVETNVIADEVCFEGSFDGHQASQRYANRDPVASAELGRRGNLLVQGDPGFDGLRSQTFSPTSGSPAARLGLAPIPFPEIGLVPDADRRSLPVTVYPPVVVPASGDFTNTLSVRLLPTPAPRGPRCRIHYTLDGSQPTSRSPAYAGPITLTGSATLKAAAIVRRSGKDVRSEVVSAEFNAKGPNGTKR